MTTTPTFIGQLRASSSTPDLVETLVSIINQAYVESEKDLFGDNFVRTTSPQVVQLIKNGESYMITTNSELLNNPTPLSVAISQPDLVLGTFTLRAVNPTTVSFGMLAVPPAYRRALNLGQAMMSHAEYLARQQGCTMLQVELIKPADGLPHYWKDFLFAWYQKKGFKIVKREGTTDVSTGIGAILAELGAVMSRPCEYITFQKDI